MAVLTPRELETAGRVALDLGVAAGRIEVAAGDREQTTVALTPLKDNAATQAAIEKATVEVRGSGDGARLVVEVKGRRLGSDVTVLVRVECPEGCDLRAHTASAEVRTSGRLGSAEVATASGDMSLDEFDGRASLKTASGDIAVASVRGAATIDSASGDVRAGRLEAGGRIHSASGDVTVAETGASLTIHTASGDQRIDAARTGEITLRSASGDLVVGIRRGSALLLDARSMSGDMSSEIELGEEPREPGADGDRVELKAVSMSGDVRVVRAPAA